VSYNLRVLVDGCCSAASLVASLSQISDRPGRCSSSKLKLPLANRLNYRRAVRSFTAPSPSRSHIFLLLPRLYSFVSNNDWVVPVLRTFPSPLFSLTPVYAANIDVYENRHYLWDTISISHGAIKP
jgi:hypothetical protein